VVDRLNIGAGVFSDLSSFYPPVRHIRLAFAEEVVAILLALRQLDRICDIFPYAVNLNVSKPAIQAVHTLEAPKTSLQFIYQQMHSLLKLFNL